MKLFKLALSNDAPNGKDMMWLKPVEGGFALYALYNNTWNPLKLVDDQDTSTLNDDKKKDLLRVSNITGLTSKQCNALNIGDQVIKKTGTQRHLYTVTYKEEKQGMCLTYIDAENVETIAYDWDTHDKAWKYTDTTITPLGS